MTCGVKRLEHRQQESSASRGVIHHARCIGKLL